MYISHPENLRLQQRNLRFSLSFVIACTKCGLGAFVGEVQKTLTVSRVLKKRSGYESRAKQRSNLIALTLLQPQCDEIASGMQQR